MKQRVRETKEVEIHKCYRTDVQSNPQLIIETDYPVTAPMPESV